jgi:hypothetical protein
VARAVASSCYRCGAPFIATTRRHPLVTLHGQSFLRAWALDLRLLISVRGPGDAELRFTPMKMRSAHRSEYLVRRCDNNVTSDGMSDITQHKIAGGQPHESKFVAHIGRVPRANTVYTISIDIRSILEKVTSGNSRKSIRLQHPCGDYTARNRLHGRVQ